MKNFSFCCLLLMMLNMRWICFFILLFPALQRAQIVHKTNPADCCYMDSSAVNGTSCKIITFKADKTTQYFETPNYPKPFPRGMTCTWAITIGKSSRIYATIEKFFLVVPDEEGCFIQTIMIRSPVEGRKMGPFCGKTGIPIINTPDNLLIIQLIDLGTKPSAIFQGFRVKFLESYETPNIELRPSLWFHNNGKPFTMNEPQIRYTLSQIDPKRNDDLKIEVPDLPDEVPPTKPPRRTRPKRRRTTLRTPVTRWRPRQQLPPSQSPLLTYAPPKQEKNFFTLEVIIGIAVGGFVVFSLLMVALIKCCQRKKKTRAKKISAAPRTSNTKYAEADFNRPTAVNKNRYVPYDHQNPCYKNTTLPSQRNSTISLPSTNPRQSRLTSAANSSRSSRSQSARRPHSSTSRRSTLKAQESRNPTREHRQHRTAHASSSKQHAPSVSTISRGQRRSARPSDPVAKERSKSSHGHRGRRDERAAARHFR